MSLLPPASVSGGIRLGYPMRRWQRECADLSVGKRFVVLALHRRAGKTELALKKLLDAAIKNTLDLPLYFYVAPLLKQAKTIAWARLKQMVQPLAATGAAEINESELFVRLLHNGAVLRLYGADNPDAMRGVRLDGVVLDEVAQMKPEVWQEILQPALSDRMGWAWFIGTPKGINLFSSLFFGADNKEGWASARYTAYDTDALPVEEVDRLRGEMTETSFAREYLCDFAASGEDQLISLTDAETAGRRLIAAGDVAHAPVVLGVDPARFGGDRSVIMRRQGLCAFEPLIWPGIDNMRLAGHVAEQIDRHKPDAVFIDAGGGAGVIDRLRQLGHDVVEVSFAGSPSQARFANKRAEMWSNMADWIRSGGAVHNDKRLLMELATPTYKFDAQNRMLLESKDDIKKRLPDAGSPDLADALALTFAHPVGRRQVGRWAPNGNHGEHDPYSALA